MVIEIIVGAVIGIILLWLMLAYNGFISLKHRVENAWAQIDVQTKKRYDLIPNLMETVKGYAKHEKSVFENVTKARSAWAGAGDNVKKRAAAENMITSALKSIMAVAENYPKLRANENFLMLQEELSGIESKIAFARQFYNDTVMRWNRKIETVPDSLLAGVFKFTKKDYFEVDEVERKNVKVNF